MYTSFPNLDVYGAVWSHFNMRNLILLVLVISSSCSVQSVKFKNSDSETVMFLTNGPLEGKALGTVSGDEGGAIWSNCQERAAKSLEDMKKKAKAMGANAIGKITWYASGNSNPSCKKSWGYLAVWPMMLTPFFMNTYVQGVAYKIDHIDVKKYPELAYIQ